MDFAAYMGIFHFLVELYVCIVGLEIAYLSLKLYIANKKKSYVFFGSGFVLIGISGIIHSANLSGDALLWVMFIGRIGGYYLILQSLTRKTKATYTATAFLPSMRIFRPYLYIINAIFTLIIFIRSLQIYKYTKERSHLWLGMAFFWLFLSEALFAISPSASATDPYWIISHLLKLTGFIVLMVYTWRFIPTRIRDRFMLAFAGISILVVFVVTLIVVVLISLKIQKDAEIRTKENIGRVFSSLKYNQTRAESIAREAAQNSSIAEAFQKKDRKMLATLLSSFGKDIDIDFLIGLDNKGVAIAGSPNLKPHISSSIIYQKYIEYALKGEATEPTVAIEESSIEGQQLSIQGAYPVRWKKNIIGVVLAGYHLNVHYMKETKGLVGTDCSLFRRHVCIATTILNAQEKRITSKLKKNRELLATVIGERRTYVDYGSIGDKSYVTVYSPLKDSEGGTVGMVSASTPLVKVQTSIANMRNVLFVMASGAVLIALIISFLLAKTISSPISRIGEGIRAIGRRDFDYQIGMDIHDEMGELSREVGDMARQLKEADQLRSDFVSFVSHELRNPLTSIKGFVETLQADGGFDEKERNEFYGIVINESERLLRMINELLDISRLDAGRSLVLNKKEMDLMNSINKVVLISQTSAGKHRIEVQSFTPHISIVADRDKMEQILINLISNAIKYSPQGGDVKVGVKEEEDGIVVSVSDSGIGMTEEQIGKLFQRYYRADHKEVRQVMGTGIGLYLTKALVEAHEGRISVESQIGKGSTFSFWIPKGQDSSELAEGGRESPC